MPISPAFPRWVNGARPSHSMLAIIAIPRQVASGGMDNQFGMHTPGFLSTIVGHVRVPTGWPRGCPVGIRAIERPGAIGAQRHQACRSVLKGPKWTAGRSQRPQGACPSVRIRRLSVSEVGLNQPKER